MRIGRSLSASLRGLLAHRLRLSLALASVAVGVAAVVLTNAIGEGAQAEVLRGIESMGTNLLVVRPAPAKRLVARQEIGGLMTSLKVGDWQAIAELDAVQAAIPGADGALRVKAGGAVMLTTVRGTSPDFLAVRRFQLRAGRFFDEADERSARRVAVLGARVEEGLFPGEEPVGRWLRIRGVPFEIIGVLAAKGAAADGSDEDNQVVIPLRTALRRVFNATWLSTVFVSVRDADRMDEAMAEIGELLRERHRLAKDGKPDDFAIQNKTRVLAARQQTAASLTLLVSGVGAVALLIGGTGILALMLLAVKERTGEIGLRMAVGARPRDILLQFLAESTVLAVGGWLAGVALGGLGAAAVALGAAWKVAVPLAALVASFLMAVATGLGFGAVPARQASRLTPIQALAAE
jgi:putative ABC transport system permease protein